MLQRHQRSPNAPDVQPRVLALWCPIDSKAGHAAKAQGRNHRQAPASAGRLDGHGALGKRLAPFGQGSGPIGPRIVARTAEAWEVSHA